jgi:hypothetical protein
MLKVSVFSWVSACLLLYSVGTNFGGLVTAVQDLQCGEFTGGESVQSGNPFDIINICVAVFLFNKTLAFPFARFYGGPAIRHKSYSWISILMAKVNGALEGRKYTPDGPLPGRSKLGLIGGLKYYFCFMFFNAFIMVVPMLGWIEVRGLTLMPISMLFIIGLPALDVFDFIICSLVGSSKLASAGDADTESGSGSADQGQGQPEGQSEGWVATFRVWIRERSIVLSWWNVMSFKQTLDHGYLSDADRAVYDNHRGFNNLVINIKYNLLEVLMSLGLIITSAHNGGGDFGTIFAFAAPTASMYVFCLLLPLSSSVGGELMHWKDSGMLEILSKKLKGEQMDIVVEEPVSDHGAAGVETQVSDGAYVRLTDGDETKSTAGEETHSA